MLYFECKQAKPKFNNTPPKNKDHCLYLCGNNIYSGSELMDDVTEQALKEYYDKINKLRNEFNNRPDFAYKITTLKGNEAKQFPPVFFNQTNNDKKIFNSWNMF